MVDAVRTKFDLRKLAPKPLLLLRIYHFFNGFRQPIHSVANAESLLNYAIRHLLVHCGPS